MHAAPVELPDGEPRFGRWRVRPIEEVVREALRGVHRDLPGVPPRPALLAVDGRPWERADVVVDGAAALPHDAATELVVAARP